jgi:hypothetical protein
MLGKILMFFISNLLDDLRLMFFGENCATVFEKAR